MIPISQMRKLMPADTRQFARVIYECLGGKSKSRQPGLDPDFFNPRMQPSTGSTSQESAYEIQLYRMVHGSPEQIV